LFVPPNEILLQNELYNNPALKSTAKSQFHKNVKIFVNMHIENNKPLFKFNAYLPTFAFCVFLLLT